jgi:hypothetical protein
MPRFFRLKLVDDDRAKAFAIDPKFAGRGLVRSTPGRVVQRLDHGIEVERRGFLSRRKLPERLEVLRRLHVGQQCTDRYGSGFACVIEPQVRVCGPLQ